MPLPMVHLTIAQQLADTLPERLDRGAFYLGNIAPDAIHMREGATRDDKQHTHFDPEKENNYIWRLQKLYHGYIGECMDEGWTSFVKGYFMHVMTDYYWFRSVYPEFVERVQEHDKREGITRTKEELSRLYYQETDQIDFTLFRTASWSIQAWFVLNEASGYELTDRLTADEILRWRDRTYSFLHGQEPGITPFYLTEEVVQAFVDTTVPRLLELLAGWEAV
ncbi:zinc dependent phospholipase C family protein [Paenibacillus barcinonensis]|uniref:Zinc dependent phospholipase C n=1 Tax=Paenibacillus barcinonensis TaxID=198119 RepID=A0A2V4W0A8_PAEBA|nr:zinc dependent phospholipase C family protein [Paenibacillus barcinonensis]PYE47790.1 zinc dependent phospholipase C [Paenibacillus barcinonensis]QKS59099.1 zinc dependent phospholipase C family protein [Paenibacillus barcinonensis]